MVGSRGALPRRFLVFCLAALICSASLLYWAGTGRAEQLVASWYGPGFAGLTTASGEPFDPNGYTAASKTLPLGTKLIVTYNGKSVVVRVNDRGPYVAGRDLDLSQAAAEYIGLTAVGYAPVNVDYADASTPVGPYNAKAANSTAPGATAPSGSTMSENVAPATSPAPPAASPGQTSAAAQQQPAQDQYASPPVAQATPPTPAQDQYAPPPPPPAPDALETPPPDLVKPDSTVKQRVVEHLAAPPKGFEKLAEKPAPPPAPAPRATTQVERKSAPQVATTQQVEQTTPQVEQTTPQVEQTTPQVPR